MFNLENQLLNHPGGKINMPLITDWRKGGANATQQRSDGGRKEERDKERATCCMRVYRLSTYLVFFACFLGSERREERENSLRKEREKWEIGGDEELMGKRREGRPEGSKKITDANNGVCEHIEGMERRRLTYPVGTTCVRRTTYECQWKTRQDETRHISTWYVR